MNDRSAGTNPFADGLTNAQVIEYLDIRAPFLMIDRVETIRPGEYARSVKTLEPDEWFFGCHLPSEGVMPGTLQVEAMLQTFVLMLYTMDGHKGKPAFITRMNITLRAKVKPSDTLCIEAQLASFRRGIAKGTASASANGVVVCEGEFTYASPHLFPR